MDPIPKSDGKEFEIDMFYENLAAPKYFDFTQIERQHDIVAVEAWFDQTPADPVSPQVLNAKAAGRSTAPMDISPAAQKISKVKENRKGKEDTSSGMMLDAGASGGFDCSPALAASTNNSAEPMQQSSGRLHRMQTRSITKAVEEGTPLGSCNVSSVSEEPPESALRAKSLYSQMCEEAGPTAAAAAGTKAALLGPSRLGQVGRMVHAGVQKLVNGMHSGSGKGRKQPLGCSDNSDHLAQQAPKRQKLENGRLKQILAGKNVVLPVRSATPLTVPEEFTFRTQARLRSFNDHSDTQKIIPYVSMMEMVQNFHKKTPKRYHTVAPSENHPQIEAHAEAQFTVPRGPYLATALRERQTRSKSSKEMEEEALAKMPKFKARPLDRKVLEGDTTFAVPRLSKQPLTQPEAFHFATADRAHRRPSAEGNGQALDTAKPSAGGQELPPLWQNRGPTIAQEPHLETRLRSRPTQVKSTAQLEEEAMAKMPKFKARPVSKRVMESSGELGVPRVPKRPVTAALDVRLATEERAHHWTAGMPPAQVARHAQDPSDPSLWDPEITAPQPFNLNTEERGKEKEQRLREKLAREDRSFREARVPRAQPLPRTTDVKEVLKKPPVPPPTTPTPFPMPGLQRHEEELRRLAAEKAAAEAALAKQREFHAQPNLSKLPPFIPEKSRQPLTQLNEFSMHINRRAEEHAKFEKQVLEKQEMLDTVRQKFEEERRVNDENEEKVRRKELVHHALPMPAFNNPFMPHRSARKPTRPVSPPLGLGHHNTRQAAATAGAGDAAYNLRNTRMR
eukprot:TRINITY_DN32596_c0_g1_i1.p1 TRINITY_DN32596_c0_g1~~TRINITY_DN32596_c0_g1_i1.p1  ORF type:complete len:791 (-),score=170.30 TRINITY_DN32596_c0_g1_i1:425-2797(-)